MEFSDDKLLYKNVAIITTGGTITSKYDEDAGGVSASLSGKELVEAIPEIMDICNVKRIVEVSKIDSSDMSPEIWIKLAKTVNKLNCDDEIGGILILHGTDTLEDTAYFINLVISPNKPIVLTGSMRSASEKDTDGPRNIADSLRVIASSNIDYSVIMTVISGKIMSACAVKKKNTCHVDAFCPGYFGLMGFVDNFTITWLNRPLAPLRFHTIPDVLPRVDIISVYPGATGDLLVDAIEKYNSRGIVVIGYGAGNVNKEFFKTLKMVKLSHSHVPIVIESRCEEGNVEPLYACEGGGVSLCEIGVLFGKTLSPSKIRILLMLSIANGVDLEGDEEPIKYLPNIIHRRMVSTYKEHLTCVQT